MWKALTDSDGATRLHLEQTGFSVETKAAKVAIEGAKYSWMNFGEQLKKALEQ